MGRKSLPERMPLESLPPAVRDAYTIEHGVSRVTESNGKFLVDAEGNRVGVVLGMEEYEKLMADLEALESIRAYDAAKAAGDEAIPFEKAVDEIQRRRR